MRPDDGTVKGDLEFERGDVGMQDNLIGPWARAIGDVASWPPITLYGWRAVVARYGVIGRIHSWRSSHVFRSGKMVG